MNENLAMAAPLAAALLVALVAGGTALAAGLGFAVAAMAYTFAGTGVLAALAGSRLVPQWLAPRAHPVRRDHG
jgi:membrane protein implicated in regulation of membrane protease activity